MSLSTNDSSSILKYNINCHNNRSSVSPVLVVRAKWSWESESIILKLNPFDPVGEAMRAAGFTNTSSIDLSKSAPLPKSENIFLKKSVISTMSTAQNIKYYSIQESPKSNDPQDESRIFYICNGKILLEEVSFDFQGVKNGMTIIIHTKIIKKNKNEKKLRFLQSMKHSSPSNMNTGNDESRSMKKSNFGFNIDQHLNQNQQVQIQMIRKAANEANLIDQSRRSEISRLNDMAFNAWEIMPEYPTLLKEMLKNEEEEDKNWSPKKRNSIIYTGYNFSNNFSNGSNNNSTILINSTQVNDQPLPNPFIKKNNLSRSSHVKSIESDFPNVSRTERKNHFSKTYKKQNKSE